MKIKVGISSRHCHLTLCDKNILFGENYELLKKNDLKQTKEFSCLETISIKIDNVRIIGPLRDYTQVEVSKTDSYVLGIDPPLRDSGDLENSETITIIGPKGEIKKENSCIIANRHIHMSSKFALENNYKNKEAVRIFVEGEKSGLLDNVYIKVSDNYVEELHLDTDDANAFFLKNSDEVEVLRK